jgi:hypothetical protein
MANLTLSVTEETKEQLKRFMWVNWSEIAREEAIKKLIFEKYIKTGEINEEEWKFCEKIDWHPVDELPLREDFKNKLKKIKEERGIKFNNIKELRKIIEG